MDWTGEAVEVRSGLDWKEMDWRYWSGQDRNGWECKGLAVEVVNGRQRIGVDRLVDGSELGCYDEVGCVDATSTNRLKASSQSASTQAVGLSFWMADDE